MQSWGANIDLCKGAKQEPDEDEEEEKDDPTEEEKAAETKLLITAVTEPDSENTQQQLPVGASWEQIVFPDTLTVTVKELTAKTDTEGKSEAEGTESQLTLTGITWEIDPEESDGDTFDSSADSNGKCYVYVPILPDTDADGNELCLDEDAELPMIYVLIGEHGIMPILDGTTKTYKTGQTVSETIDLTPYIQNLQGITSWSLDFANDGNPDIVFTNKPTANIDNGTNKCTVSYTISDKNSKETQNRWVLRVEHSAGTYPFAIVINIVEALPVHPANGQSVAPNGTLTYGENISKLTFQSVKFVDGEGKEVSGTLKWADGATGRIWLANTQPDDTEIPKADRKFTCIFSPDDPLYETTDYNVEVIIYPAKPTVAQAPLIPALERRETPYTAEEIISLSESAVQLTDIDGNPIAADKITWTWKGSENTTDTKNWSTGQHTETIVATYTDGINNYQPVELPVTITVTKSTPLVPSVTTSGNYEHGAYLREQTLIGTVTDKDGKPIKAEFVWKNPNTQLSVSDNGNEYEYICIPYDTENYDHVERTAAVTVSKPEYPPERPAGVMNVPKSCDVVSKIALPTGWQWSESDKDEQLAENAAVSVTAEYTGTDKDDYANTTVTVSVKRSSTCEHTKTSNVIVNTPPTCITEGIGLIECAFGCGEIVRNNITIPKTAHDYQRREAKSGESALFDYYKCSVCGKEYMTAAQPPAPGDGSGGGSGSGSGSSGGTGSDNGSSGSSESSTAPTPQSTPAALLPTPTATQNPLLPELGSKPTAGKQLLNFLPKNDADDQNKAPFIKGENGKEGWEIIRTETEGTPEGSTVTVDMNGAVIVPSEVLADIQGRDVTLVFDMGNGITWSVNGLSITGEVGDIDFGVAMGAQAGRSIPVEVLNNVTGERYAMNLTLAYDGEFGFTAVLTVNMKAENAGLYANLFYYNPSTVELEFVCCDLIREDGATDLTFTHASDYTIVIDSVPMDGSAKAADDALKADAGAGNTGGSTDGAGNMDGVATTHGEAAWNPLWIILIGAVVIVVGLGVFVIARKKRDNGNE